MGIAANIPNELLWDLSVQEIEAVLECHQDKERAANLRAGLVSATYINIHRRKGARLVQPGDFIRDRSEHEYMSVEEATKFMKRWAKVQNRAAAINEDTA